MSDDIIQRINGWFLACEKARCQELEPDASPLLEDCKAEIERLRLAIRRLADQDATLAVRSGNVTVIMDVPLTDEEREAIKTAVGGFGMWVTENNLQGDESLRLALVTLRGLLERLA